MTTCISGLLDADLKCDDPLCTCPYPWPEGAKLESEFFEAKEADGDTVFYTVTWCPGHRGLLKRRMTAKPERRRSLYTRLRMEIRRYQRSVVGGAR